MFETTSNNITPIDQAFSLRKINSTENINVIAITGGKGGIGKTNIAINLSIALADLQRSIMLLDSDFGLSNVDVVLGLNARKNLYHVLSGDCELEEILIEGPHGVQIIPAAPGVSDMANLSVHEHLGIIDSISQLNKAVDYFLIDTAAGISNGVCLFSRIATNILVIVCDEPASIADAYALIKVLSNKGDDRKFFILANMVDSNAHGEQLFNQLNRVSNHFLDITLEYIGYVPNDNFMKKAIQKQKSVLDIFPSSRASLAFNRLARKIETCPKEKRTTGAVELFLERQLSEQNLSKV